MKDDNKFEELGHGPWPGASLLHGQLDEEAEAIAFQEAVAAWRNAGGLAHWGDASVDKVSKSIFPLKRCRNEKLKKTGMEALESVHFFAGEAWKISKKKAAAGEDCEGKDKFEQKIEDLDLFSLIWGVRGVEIIGGFCWAQVLSL